MRPRSPREDLLLDRATARAHHAELVAVGCPVIEIVGYGWLPGHRYLVMLDHAGSKGASDPCPMVRAIERITVAPFSVAWFERIERTRLRPVLRRWARARPNRRTCDVPARGPWPDGPPSQEQGCDVAPVSRDPSVSLGLRLG